jgi:hypothetical protein
MKRKKWNEKRGKMINDGNEVEGKVGEVGRGGWEVGGW